MPKIPFPGLALLLVLVAGCAFPAKAPQPRDPAVSKTQPPAVLVLDSRGNLIASVDGPPVEETLSTPTVTYADTSKSPELPLPAEAAQAEQPHLVIDALALPEATPLPSPSIPSPEPTIGAPTPIAFPSPPSPAVPDTKTESNPLAGSTLAPATYSPAAAAPAPAPKGPPAALPAPPPAIQPPAPVQHRTIPTVPSARLAVDAFGSSSEIRLEVGIPTVLRIDPATHLIVPQSVAAINKDEPTILASAPDQVVIYSGTKEHALKPGWSARITAMTADGKPVLAVVALRQPLQK